MCFLLTRCSLVDDGHRKLVAEIGMAGRRGENSTAETMETGRGSPLCLSSVERFRFLQIIPPGNKGLWSVAGIVHLALGSEWNVTIEMRHRFGDGKRELNKPRVRTVLKPGRLVDQFFDSPFFNRVDIGGPGFEHLFYLRA